MRWLLRRLLERELVDSIFGDFEEYARQHYPRSRARAALWTWRQLLGVVVAALAQRARDELVASSGAGTRNTSPWLARWAAQFGQDSTYALRTFRCNPGFSLAAVLTLSLGIGCTTAIFSIVHALLVRSLPYDGAAGLVQIAERPPADEIGVEADALSPIAAAHVPALRARSSSLSHVGLHAPTLQTMSVQGETVRIGGARLSPVIFEMLRAQPALGRVFRSDEEAPGAERSVILSFAAWHRYFRGDPDVLARRILLDGESFAIVGVMAEGFYFPDRQTDIWTPFVLGPVIRGRSPVLARMREGVTVQTANVEVNALLSALSGESPAPEGRADGRLRFDVVQARDALTAPVKPALTVLTIAVGLVLLIACANVANLLVARGLARRREIAVRRALGAGRFRLVRQALTESVLLAVCGGIAGIVLAVSMIEVLQAIAVGLARRDLGPGLSIPRLDEVRLDGVALLFTLGVSMLAGVVFGVLPAIEQSQANAVDVLRGDSGAGFSIAGRRPIRGVLIIVQIAVATTLLVAAGLQIHSFARLARVDPGYDPRSLLTFQVVFADNRGTPTFADDLVAALHRLPGVRAAGYSSSLPMVQSVFISPLSRTPGPPKPPATPSSSPTPEFPDSRAVSRGFLDALGVRVIAGRGLSPQGPSSGPREILINRAFARTGYLGRDPVGEHVYSSERFAEVVGIVDDVRQIGLDQPAAPQVFVLAEGGGPGLYYAVRTSGRPAAHVGTIRQIVRRLVPEAGLYNVATMDQIVSNSVGRRRLYAVSMGAFAAIAAALAAVGLYGMVAYSVALRTREIGIRIALGAQSGHVLGLVMREAGALIATGLLLGLAGARVMTRALESMLVAVTALDPATYGVVAMFFACITLTAAFAAARRAVAGDPLTALRSE
jgi:putative ABC transport system permease protein